MKKLLTLSIVCALFAFTKVSAQEIQVPLAVPETTDQSTQSLDGVPRLIKTVNITEAGIRLNFSANGALLIEGDLSCVRDNNSLVSYYSAGSVMIVKYGYNSWDITITARLEGGTVYIYELVK